MTHHTTPATTLTPTEQPHNNNPSRHTPPIHALPNHVLVRVGCLLLVALLAVTIATIPAAANVDTTGTYTLNADNIATNDIPATNRTTTTTITAGTPDDPANSGDSFHVGLNDDLLGPNHHEGTIEIRSATATATNPDQAVDATITANHVYTGQTDAVNITITDDNNATTVTITATITITAHPDTDLASSAADYTTDPLLIITDPGTFTTGETFRKQEPVATLTVTPGAGDALTLHPDTALHDTELTYNQTGTITAQVTDAHGNTVTDYTDGHINLALTTTDIPTRTTSNHTLTDGTTAITIGPTADLTPAIGTFTLTATHTPDDNPALTPATQPLTIRPEHVAITHPTDITADTPSTPLTVELQDAANTPIPNHHIDTYTTNFTLTDGPSETATIATDNTTIGPLTNDTPLTHTATTNTNKPDHYTLNTTHKANYSITATVQPASVHNPAQATHHISVDNGNPAALNVTVTPNQTAYEAGQPTATVTITDTHGNPLDDADIPGKTPRLTVSLIGNAGHYTDTTTNTDITSATTKYHIRGADTGGDLEAGVGTFTVQVEDEIDGLNDTDSDELTVYPDGVRLDNNRSSNEFDAGNQTDLNLTLVDHAGSRIDDAVVDEVDVAFSLSTVNLQDGVTSHDVAIDGDEPGTALGVRNGSSFHPVGSTTAGEYQLAVDVMPSISDAPTAETEETTVHALAVDDIGIDSSDAFVGTVEHDSSTATATLTLTDEHGNYVDYSHDRWQDIQLTVPLGDQHLATITNTQVADTVTDADGTVTATFDPETDIEATQTGATMLDATAANNASGTTPLDVVHEAFSLAEGFQRVSLPQPARVSVADVSHITTWNTTTETYDDDGVDLLDGVADGDTELHHGLYVAGESTTARIGFDYTTDTSVTVGQASFEAGWNFVGTNFDISNTANTPMPFTADLITVDEIPADPSATAVVYDGGLTTMLDASSNGDNTSHLTPRIEYRSHEGGEYGTYWVYIEDPSTLTSPHRQLVGPQYDPLARDTITTP